jgi:UDP-N-acetylmuramyl pentapeptide phosphotransferase/UDP-N-acetylglucosamine-1-phosphate transferase
MSVELPLRLLADLALAATAAAVASLLIRALFPLLERYALARPNARSSHQVPTAQGGGLAVVAATLLLSWIGAGFAEHHPEIGPGRLLMVTAAVVGLALTGAVDDIRPLGVWPRLALQAAAAVVLVLALPASCRVLPALAGWLEASLLVVGLVWFINLTNFMDGIDGMTVAEVVPLSAALVVLTHLDAMPGTGGLLALALAGALIGFAPYNRHVARLFLGDVGSLPIGALVGWLLILLAGRGHIAAALLLPLYYVADSGLTLLHRWRSGERLAEAHRAHFYQTALRRGMTVPEVTWRVAGLNIVLGLLAILTTLADAVAVDLVALLVGGLAVAAVLESFTRWRG